MSTRIPVSDKDLFVEPKWFRREGPLYERNFETEDSSHSNFTIRLLPLFPFDYGVCYPTGIIPLNIFVMKYRMLVNDVKKTDSLFGMILSDGKGGLCEVGTCVENLTQDLQPDGRQLLKNVCRKRFKILEITQDEPYIIAKVLYPIEDSDLQILSSMNQDFPDHLLNLEKQVYQIMVDVVALSNKLISSQPDLSNFTVSISDEVKSLSSLEQPSRLTHASDFSFALCDMLNGSITPSEAQLLLESETLELRLSRIYAILSETRDSLMSRVEIAEEPFN